MSNHVVWKKTVLLALGISLCKMYGMENKDTHLGIPGLWQVIRVKR
jgi:hypothetical protein